MSTTAYIALGSNLGDRQTYLNLAIDLLRAAPGITITKVSAFRETAPVGGPPNQGNYLNAAAEIQCDLDAAQLLQTLLQVEQKLGRERRERYGPRTIDLDLLLYGDRVIHEPNLIVPHPRMHERLFVLVPLAEIAAEVVHPVLQRTIGALLEQCNEAPMHELAGLRALVTGSTSGIGRAIALALAAAGANVIIHGRRSQEAAEAVAAQVRAAGSGAHVIMADLRESNECRRLTQTAWDHWQGMDIWINNAGADTLTGAALHWSFEQKLAELLAVDVTATLLLARDIGQRMKKAGQGVILNMGWDQAESGMEGDSGQLFATAKAAVMAFSKSLALNLAPHVRVNCLAPGWIRTAWGERASEYWQERVQSETPLGRWGTPEDVAATARWLVSPAAGFITGQVIRINGGTIR